MKKTKLTKILTLAMVTTMLFAAVGCGAKDNSAKDNSADATSDVINEETADSKDDTATEDAVSESSDQHATGIFKGMETVDLNGEAVDRTVFADNKLTLVNVWSTGCTPCIMEIPELEKINQEYADKGVAVKGLLYELQVGLTDEIRADVEEILTKAGATYQQLTVSESMFEADELQNMAAFPTTFFVDSEGNIVKTVEGSRDFDGWKELIDSVLEEMGNE